MTATRSLHQCRTHASRQVVRGATSGCPPSVQACLLSHTHPSDLRPCFVLPDAIRAELHIGGPILLQHHLRHQSLRAGQGCVCRAGLCVWGRAVCTGQVSVTQSCVQGRAVCIANLENAGTLTSHLSDLRGPEPLHPTRSLCQEVARRLFTKWSA